MILNRIWIIPKPSALAYSVQSSPIGCNNKSLWNSIKQDIYLSNLELEVLELTQFFPYKSSIYTKYSSIKIDPNCIIRLFNHSHNCNCSSSSFLNATWVSQVLLALSVLQVYSRRFSCNYMGTGLVHTGAEIPYDTSKSWSTCTNNHLAPMNCWYYILPSQRSLLPSSFCLVLKSGICIYIWNEVLDTSGPSFIICLSLSLLVLTAIRYVLYIYIRQKLSRTKVNQDLCLQFQSWFS